MDEMQSRKIRISDSSWAAFSALADSLGLSQGRTLEELMLQGGPLAMLSRNLGALSLRRGNEAFCAKFYVERVLAMITRARLSAEVVNPEVERNELVSADWQIHMLQTLGEWMEQQGADHRKWAETLSTRFGEKATG